MKRKIIGSVIVATVLLATLCLYLFLAAPVTMPKEYTTYIIKAPNTDQEVVIMEWVSFKTSGADFYMKNGDSTDYLQSIYTNEYCPFAQGHYNVIWELSQVTIEYQYSVGGVWKKITLNLTEEARG